MIVEVLNKYTGANIDTIWQVRKITESCERFYIKSVDDFGFEEIHQFNTNAVELRVSF